MVGRPHPKVLLLPQRALMELKKRKKGANILTRQLVEGAGPISAFVTHPGQDLSPVAAAASVQFYTHITAHQPLFLLLLLPSPGAAEARGVLANKP